MLNLYPGTYTLNDIYIKSFLDGGPTLSQLLYLFESGVKRKYQDFISFAAVHGVKLDDPFAETGNGKTTSPKVRSTDGFMFGDPEAYENMPQEDRDAITRKMMQKHRVWNNTGYVE